MLGGSQLLKHVLKQIVAKRHASVRISSSRESQSPQSSRRWRSTDLLHPCEQMVIQCRNAKIMIRNGGIHQAPCELCEPKHRALDLSLFRLDDCGRQHQILSKTYIYIYICIYIYKAIEGESECESECESERESECESGNVLESPASQTQRIKTHGWDAGATKRLERSHLR